MSRKKRCIKCGEFLVCDSCKTPQNQEIPGWDQLNFCVSAKQKERIQLAAEKHGVSVSSYIRSLVEVENEESANED